jgi:hypothetical protein
MAVKDCTAHFQFLAKFWIYTGKVVQIYIRKKIKIFVFQIRFSKRRKIIFLFSCLA